MKMNKSLVKMIRSLPPLALPSLSLFRFYFRKIVHWFSLHLTYRLLLCYLFIYLICFIVCWMLVAVVFADECRYASHRFMAISNSNIGIHSYSIGFALENANYFEQILTMCRNENVLLECCRCRIFSSNWQLVMGKLQSTKVWYKSKQLKVFV